MFKVTYLRDSLYFESFEDVKSYFSHPEALDLDELMEKLEADANALDVPVPSIEVI